MEKKRDEITFKDLMNIFVPKLWLIIVISVVCATAFGLYSALLKEDTYTSSSTMYVYKSANSATTTDISVAEEMVEIYELIINTDEVLNMVALRLPDKYNDYNITSSALRGTLNVSPLGTSGMFKISVTTTDPELSLAIAESAEKVIPSEIMNRIPNALHLTVLESPSIAKYSNDKNVARNTLIGFLVGFLISAIAVFVFSLFDVVIHDKKKIEDNFNIPILGSIPHYEIDAAKGAQ